MRVSVVTAYHGGDVRRLLATEAALEKWMLQDVEAEWIFVEMIRRGGRSDFHWLEGLPFFRHIRVESGPANEGAWQKEALLNIGMRSSGSEIVVVLDSDVWSDDPGWLEAMASAAEDGGDSMVQGFREVVDTKDPDYRFYSLKAGMEYESGDANPGLAWAAPRKVFERGGWLNPFCFYGSGDSMMASEYLGAIDPLMNDWCLKFPVFAGLRRTIQGASGYSFVDVALRHANHGGGRGHHAARHWMTAWFSKPMRELVALGPEGLVEWVDPECPERRMAARQREMTSFSKVEAICAESGGRKNINIDVAQS